MKRVFCRSLITVLAFVCCLQAQTLKQIVTIDLPGPKGERFDYLTMDDEDHYLLSAHLGPGILYVIDVGTNKVVKAIPGVPGVTGLEYVPGLRKVYTSDWGEEKIGVVDLRSMRVIKRLATAAKPNGSAYAAPFHKVYVSDTLGKAVAIVDVDKDEIVRTIEFKSETGMPQYDSVARKVYVNLRNTNEIAEIDPATDTVLGSYPVEGCRYNHGMACFGYSQGDCASSVARRGRCCEIRSWLRTNLRRLFQRLHCGLSSNRRRPLSKARRLRGAEDGPQPCRGYSDSPRVCAGTTRERPTGCSNDCLRSH